MIIRSIRDRVVQQALLQLLNPIFEADLLPEQYGFRSSVDAKQAIRRVYYHIMDFRRVEIVDADLKDYFNQISHGSLMRCLTRRLSDKGILRLIKQWIESPVIEERSSGDFYTSYLPVGAFGSLK